MMNIFRHTTALRRILTQFGLLLIVCASAQAQNPSVAPTPCDDFNPCTFDQWLDPPGECVNSPVSDGTPCAGSDGNFCTSVCIADQAGEDSTCTPIQHNPCDTGSASNGYSCYVGTCDPSSGDCSTDPAPDGTPCDEQSVCSESECQQGACTWVNDVECDDQNLCTVDYCSESMGGCQFDPVASGTGCEDGLFCNGHESCNSNGECKPDPDTVCPAGSFCDETNDQCMVPPTDADQDGVDDDFDNCVTQYNPDQANADCPDPSFLIDGGCSSAGVPPAMAGCCDGGDICDACPANSDNSRCWGELSGGFVVGPGGGDITFGDCIKVDVPNNAVTNDTSISISALKHPWMDPDVSDNLTFQKKAGGSLLHRLVLLPRDVQFQRPIRVEFCWEDTENDGVIDFGFCGDNFTTCSTDLACDAAGVPGPCTLGPIVQESELEFRFNGEGFDLQGIDEPGSRTDRSSTAGIARCGDTLHQSPQFCDNVEPDCAADPRAVAAKCCDKATDVWPVETCSGGEFSLGELPGSLIPGKGSEKTDCAFEWGIVNPFNSPMWDNKGYLNPSQICTDGDPTCDGDGIADGKCTFIANLCVNVEDRRLFHRATGETLCTPTAMEYFLLKKPRPDSRRPYEADNAIAMRDAIASLDPTNAAITGRRDEIVYFTSPFDTRNACTNTFPIVVPLKGKDMDRASRASISAQGLPLGPLKKDSDTLKLGCMPSPAGTL